MHPSLPAPRSRAARRLAAAVAAVLAAALLTAPAPATGAAPDKLQPAARQALAGGRTADLIVELTERADLRPARELRITWCPGD